jgi:ABC-type nitrate/sulfonate/bicarbonate transport system substrate-binding protein
MVNSASLSSVLTIASLIFFARSSLALDRITIGLSSLSPTNGAIWVADEQGLFRKHGIETRVVAIGGGAARAISVLVSGEVQFASAGGIAVIRAALAGADVVMVASVLNQGIQRVLTRPELKSPKDLIGKKVGIAGFGSASHVVFLLLLQKWGISPEQIQIVQADSSPAMLLALEKVHIDGAVLTEPYSFVAEDRGFRVLADPADSDIFYLQNMLATTRGYLRTHYEQSTKFIKGYVEGLSYFKKNKKQSLEILRKKLKLGSQQERYLEKSYDLYVSKYYDRSPYPSLQGVKTLLEYQVKNDPKARGVDPNSFIDPSIVKNLDQSGFIRLLYE